MFVVIIDRLLLAAPGWLGLNPPQPICFHLRTCGLVTRQAGWKLLLV